MRASVRIKDPEGKEHELGPGDIIGRLWTAALPIPDGRISEAHALVSLREGRLLLIRLRGGLALRGEPMSEIVLDAGQRILLARGIEIEVVAVEVPDEIMVIEGLGATRPALSGVCSIMAGPPARLVAGWREDAAAHLWSTGDAWWRRVGDEPAVRLVPDDVWTIGTTRLRAVAVATRTAGHSATRARGDLPLKIVAQYDTVHLHRDGEPPVVLAGHQARLVSELVALDGPVAWRVLAEQLWTDEPDEFLLRGRLDVLLSRLRRSLRARGVRTDLVRTDGAGRVELVRYPNDEIEDRT